MDNVRIDAENGLLRVAVYDFSKPVDKCIVAMHVFKTVDDRGLVGLLYQLALHNLGDINQDTKWHVCVMRMPLDFKAEPVQCFNWYPFNLAKQGF